MEFLSGQDGGGLVPVNVQGDLMVGDDVAAGGEGFQMS